MDELNRFSESWHIGNCYSLGHWFGALVDGDQEAAYLSFNSER